MGIFNKKEDVYENMRADGVVAKLFRTAWTHYGSSTHDYVFKDLSITRLIKEFDLNVTEIERLIKSKYVVNTTGKFNQLIEECLFARVTYDSALNYLKTGYAKVYSLYELNDIPQEIRDANPFIDDILPLLTPIDSSTLSEESQKKLNDSMTDVYVCFSKEFWDAFHSDLRTRKSETYKNTGNSYF
jgi:hypothetical protein